MFQPSRGGRAVLAAAVLLTLALPAPAAAEEAETAPVVLDPLVVSATRTERPLSQVGSSLTVITAEDLEDRQTVLVSDILREVPGVAVNRSGGVGALTQVRLRGAEGNHTLVLIDGIEVNDPAGGSEFDFAHLLAADIDRIEVLRGPQSVLYGSEAIGGVINIVTRRGDGPPEAAASLEGGSFRSGRASASLAAGGERYDLLFSGSHFRTRGISHAKAPRGGTDPDGYENTTAFAKLGVLPFENLRLDFVGRLTRYDMETDDFVGGVGAFEADQDTRGDQRYGRAQATLDLLDGRWRQRLGASLSRLETRNRTNGSRTGRSIGRRTKFDYQSDFAFSTPGFASAAHVVTLGAEHEREGVESSSAWADLDRSFRSRSFYAQYQLDLFERLSLSAGLRHDDNQLFRNAQTYRLTALYSHPETGTRLRGSYGTGVKNPTVFELYGFSQNYSGNPDLEPERGRGWDLGLEQDLFDRRLTLGATYFRQEVDKLITGSGQTSVNLDGRSRSQGVELTAALTLSNGLDLRGAYTYTRTRDPNGDRLVRRPAHTGSLNLNYRFLEDRANLNLGVVYNGRQHDYAFDQFFNRSVVTLKSYTLVGLAGSYRVAEGVELFGRVENLLDRNYEEVFTYASPGRAAYAGVRLRF